MIHSANMLAVDTLSMREGLLFLSSCEDRNGVLDMKELHALLED